MDKQEVIEEIRIRAKYDSEYRTSLIRSDKAIELIKKIDESESRQLDEPQKVKVPAFVAEYIEANRRLYLSDIFDGDWLSGVDGSTEDKTSKWLYDNEEEENNRRYLKAVQAFVEGYEVEEEPKWKIINDDKYCLTSIEAGYGNSLHWAFDSTKKKPILFDNEETAMYTAYITGGTVEQVEV